jgi:hypothetical protein
VTIRDYEWVSRSCTLPLLDRPLRLAEFDELFATGLRAQERLSPTALRWRLRPAAESTARELTARERQCCSFFSFTIIRNGDVVQLDITVPPMYVDVLDALAQRATTRIHS